MEVKAQAKYIRMSPKKLRLVAQLIKGMNVEEATNQLKFTNKRGKGPLLEVLSSAIHNGENNFALKRENLYIKKIVVDEGSTLKRWKPRAFGRATPIRKRSSHITVLLDERIKEFKEKKRKERLPEPEVVETFKKEPKKEIPQIEVSQKLPEEELGEKKNKKIFDKRRKGKYRFKQHLDKTVLKRAGGALKRIFRRKAG